MCADLAGSRTKKGVGRGTAVTWHGGLAKKPEAESWRLCSFISAGKKLCKDVSLLGMPLGYCKLRCLFHLKLLFQM